MQDFEYDVFISYSHKDTAWVKQTLLPVLQKERINYHYDADFDPGVPSIINMEAAVEKSRKTILVLTPNWTKSDWSSFEEVLAHTLDPIGRQRRLIPILVQPCQLPSRVGSLSYIDLTELVPGTPDFELGMQRLVRAIRKPAPPPQSPKNTRPPHVGTLSIPLPSQPIEHPEWKGGLQLKFKDDIYLLAPTNEQPIEKYETEEKDNVIWQARALQLKKQSRPVWLKQVIKLRDTQNTQSNFQSIRTEYSLLERLAFVRYVPQSVNIYDQKDAITLVYRYQAGQTLAKQYILSNQPLDRYYIKPFLSNLLPLCETLKALHNEKRAHRMLSPTSIIMLQQPSRTIILRDLGLAAFPVRRKEGSGEYQAPEQVDWNNRSNMPGPQTDIYQLAAIIYRILTGLPVRSPWNILPPGTANDYIPATIDTLLLRALSPEPQQRWPYIDDFAKELRRAIDQM